MTRAQGLLVVATCGLALAWFTSSGRVAHPHAASGRPSPSRVARPAEGDITEQALRLQSHLSAARPLRPSQRNLFEFREAVPASVPVRARRPATTPGQPAAEREEERPEMRLLGIAEDPSAQGTVRTAVVSALSQLFMVREGERVLGRYQVVRIAADAVELKDGDRTFRLGLR